MALGYDGSIRIDTKIDSKGFSAGINSMGNSLKKLAGVIGVAFGTAAIVNFGKEAINAASQLSNAWMGLESIVEGQGRSFSAAKSFINDYISDGLVPLENAVTAYKNLAARGYDDEQIQKTLVALKDAAAFGRQASYSLGDAVTSATEGLKNENSVLVDNAGVTKNVAKMWDDYAKSIGTTANNLTQEQKIQAEVNGILEETRFQTGDAAKVAGTYSGQLSLLSYNFQQLKVNVGNALIPIAEAVLPSINAIISALSRLASVFAQVSAMLFGKSSGLTQQAGTQKEIAASGSAAADATEDLAGATEDAGAAAKKAEKDMKGVLAGFDELNILATDAADSVSGAASGMDIGADLGLDEATGGGELFGDVEISPEIAAFVEKLRDAFSSLWDALQPFSETVGAGLQWLWENVLVPLGKWTVDEALPAFLDVLAAGIELLTKVLIALEPYATWLWENFLEPVAAWTGGVIISVLKDFADLLRDIADLISGDISFSEFISGLTPLQTALLSLAAAFVAVSLAGAVGGAVTAVKTFISAVKGLTATGIFGKLAEVFLLVSSGAGTLSEAMAAVFGPGSIIAGIAAIVGGAVLAVTNFLSMLENGFSWVNEALMVLGIAIAAVGAVILGAPAAVAAAVAAVVAAIATAAVFIKENWEEIKEAFIAAWEKIKEAWSVVATWFDEKVIQPIVNFFSSIVESIGGFFSTLWDNIVSVWNAAGEWFEEHVAKPIKEAFQAVGDFVKGIFNGIIGFVEGMINAAINAINKFIGGFSDIVSTAADFIGVEWNGIRKLPTVSLPRLANGAVIPPNQQFAAVLGDQRSGKNLEAPASLIKQMVSEALAEAGGMGSDRPIEVNVILDKQIVGRVMVNQINDMTRAAGKPVLLY